MFSQTKAQATLAKMNTRTVNHGKDKVGAVDLIIRQKLANEILLAFDPALLEAMYVDGDVPVSKNGELDPFKTPANASQKKRRFGGKIPSIHMHDDYGLVGAQITIGFGPREETAIVLTADVNKFIVTLNDEGIIDLQYRIKCSPDPKDVSKLYQLQEREITLTVNPAQSDMLDPTTQHGDNEQPPVQEKDPEHTLADDGAPVLALEQQTTDPVTLDKPAKPAKPSKPAKPAAPAKETTASNVTPIVKTPRTRRAAPE